MEKCYIHFEEIDSTNSWAKNHLSTFAKDKLIIISAEKQNAGYGQKKRLWISPKGEGLWVTFCFYAEEADSFVITRMMADSLVLLLAEEGVEGQIKWPNDILVKGKKIAGILTEVADGFIIIGVGLNVNMPHSTFIKVEQPITSLLALTNKVFSTESILISLVKIFNKRIVK